MSADLVPITVTLRSAARFGGRSNEGNILRTLDYIPGRCLRGAMARQFLADPANGGEAGDLFSWAFLDGGVRWPDLHFSEGHLTPLSQRVCKLYPEAHAVIDELWHTSGDSPACCTVPGCGAPLERAVPKMPVRRIVTRTALDSSTHTARLGSLHSLEVIQEGQKFVGDLRFDAQGVVADRFLGWIRSACQQPPAIGGGRSRGLGEIEMLLGVPVALQPVMGRLERWNSGASETRFAVTLTSPVILRDSLWRYCSTLSAERLSHDYPGLGTLKPVAAWAQTEVVAGWNDLTHLPREQALSIVRGSVFIFSSPMPILDIAGELDRLEQQEIGERRAEGYGAVSVCSEAHLNQQHTGGRKK